MNEYTVHSILELYAQNVSSPFDKQLINIKGFFAEGNGRTYSSGCYDEFLDDNKQHKMVIVSHPEIRKQFQQGTYYHLKGFLNRNVKNISKGSFQLLFNVQEIEKQEEEKQLITHEEVSLLQKRFDRPSVYIDQLLLDLLAQKQNPKIAIVTGNHSIVDTDVMNQLGEIEAFEVFVYRTGVTNAKELQKYFKQEAFDEYDILAIIRGGGSGLEVFDDRELCEQLIDIPIPFVTAIGHEQDVTLLERIADRGFTTPTAFGSFLKDIYNEYVQRTKQEQAIIQLQENIQELKIEKKSKIRNQDKLLEFEREKVREEIKEAKKKYMKIITILVVVIVLFLIKMIFG